MYFFKLSESVSQPV